LIWLVWFDYHLFRSWIFWLWSIYLVSLILLSFVVPFMCLIKIWFWLRLIMIFVALVVDTNLL
jgi:hypothetical protein